MHSFDSSLLAELVVTPANCGWNDEVCATLTVPQPAPLRDSTPNPSHLGGVLSSAPVQQEQRSIMSHRIAAVMVLRDLKLVIK